MRLERTNRINAEHGAKGPFLKAQWSGRNSASGCNCRRAAGRPDIPSFPALLLCAVLAGSCSAPPQPAAGRPAAQPEESSQPSSDVRSLLRDTEEQLRILFRTARGDPAYAAARVHARKAGVLVTKYGAAPAALEKARGEINLARSETNLIGIARTAPQIPALREEGYFSENDGSWQPFLCYCPPAARRGEKRPLIVYLHGYSPYLDIVNWTSIPSNLLALTESEQCLMAAPFGRGNTDFQGIGEQDVLRVISETRRRFPVDDDRVFLAGISMGGMGAWTIGCHYPHLFAGLIILAGRGDYYEWHEVDRDSLPSWKQRLIDTDFALRLLQNLEHVPVYCAHGIDDSLVPIREARRIVAAAKEAGVNVKYIEIEGFDHWIFEEVFARDDLRQWLRATSRQWPKSFTYAAFHPRYNQCYWLAHLEVLKNANPARVQVRTEDGRTTIRASGIRSISIDTACLPPGVKPEEIVCEGAQLSPDIPPPPCPTGPVREAFLSPFAFIFEGDPSDSKSAASFKTRCMEWLQYAQSWPTVINRPSEKDLASYNIFLFGEPEHSALIRRVLQNSPVKITDAHFAIGSRTFERKGRGLYAIFPNPWNPRRLAVIQCGEPWGLHAAPNHRYDFLPDFIIYSDYADPDGSNHADLAGFWNENWNVDE